MDHAALVLALMGVQGIGAAAILKVARRARDLGQFPEDVVHSDARTLEDLFGLPRRQAQALAEKAPSRWPRACEEADALARQGVRVLLSIDDDYPTAVLRRMASPPPVLMLYGWVRLLREPLFAVACSNGAPEADMAAIDAAAAVAVDAGWRPATGHNRAPYQRAALAARRFGAPVCYVLDRNLLEGFAGDLRRELFGAARIWSPTFDPKSDLALAPFMPNAHGVGDGGRRRDAVALALAGLILAAHLRPGGAMERLVREAQDHGAPVAAITPQAAEAAGLRVVRPGGDELREIIEQCANAEKRDA